MAITVTLTIHDRATATQLTVSDTIQTVVLTVTDAKGDPGKSAYQLWLDDGNEGTIADFFASLAPISAAEKNRLERRPDGLYVRDDLTPSPLAYYILAKG